MNYFGILFTFVLPGIIIGIMAAAALMREAERRRRAALRARRARIHPMQKRLYVRDVNAA